jgi:hypothetical protein
MATPVATPAKVNALAKIRGSWYQSAAKRLRTSMTKLAVKSTQ